MTPLSDFDSEYGEAMKVLSDLADLDPRDGDSECLLCNFTVDDLDDLALHGNACPWRRATLLVNAHRTTPGRSK